MMTTFQQIDGDAAWAAANHALLDVELLRLRLLLQRRVLWLRSRWKHDSARDYMAWQISEAQADWLLSGEDRREEVLFFESDPEAVRIGSWLSRVQQQIEDRLDEMRDAGTPAALDVLTRMFGLTRFERDVFLLALAPELDPGFERLYAYVQDDMTRRFATPHLALTLFPSTGEAERECFLPGATLRRWRLIRLEETVPPSVFPVRPVRLDERMLNYVLGVNRPDERVIHLLDRVNPGILSSADRERMDRIAGWLREAPNHLMRRTVNLTGPPDAGRLNLAGTLCNEMGISLFQVNTSELPSPVNERASFFSLIEREAVLLRTALYFDLDLVNPDTIPSLVREIDDLFVFSIVGSAFRWSGERETLSVSLRKPDAKEQAELWRQAVAETVISNDGQLDRIVEQFDLSAANISRAAATVAKVSALRVSGEPGDAGEDLWHACAEQAAPKLDALALRILPYFKWEDIVLPEGTFRLLQEIASQVEHRAKVYRTWGFGARLNRGRGISALFAGPSGTGKTMAAEILAEHLKLDLYRIDLAGVVSKYIGETEKNLRAIFDSAERGGVILFFDEADALFGKRSEVKDSHDRYANIEVNYLLQRMENYRGLAILATNRKSALDSAFLRRLRFIVDFPFPDPLHRQKIWQRVFPPQADVEGLDYSWLSRLEIPGGNIKNIAVNAAFLAAAKGASIGMHEVMQAAHREYVKIEKLVQESDFGPYTNAVPS